jgi:hypothetical protein
VCDTGLHCRRRRGQKGGEEGGGQSRVTPQAKGIGSRIDPMGVLMDVLKIVQVILGRDDVCAVLHLRYQHLTRNDEACRRPPLLLD